MSIELAAGIFEELVDAARRAAPREACGLLAGTDGRVTRFYPLTNADASPEHYSMMPGEQFAAVKDMRRAGLKTLGIWHSHPASPPRMSAEDLRLAYTPDVVYVILSLATEPPTLGAFKVSDGGPEPTEVSIENELR